MSGTAAADSSADVTPVDIYSSTAGTLVQADELDRYGFQVKKGDWYEIRVDANPPSEGAVPDSGIPAVSLVKPSNGKVVAGANVQPYQAYSPPDYSTLDTYYRRVIKWRAAKSGSYNINIGGSENTFTGDYVIELLPSAPVQMKWSIDDGILHVKLRKNASLYFSVAGDGQLVVGSEGISVGVGYSVSGIRVQGGSGDNNITLSGFDLPSASNRFSSLNENIVVKGGGGNDIFTGSHFVEKFNGGSGQDRIYNDHLYSRDRITKVEEGVLAPQPSKKKHKRKRGKSDLLD